MSSLTRTSTSSDRDRDAVEIVDWLLVTSSRTDQPRRPGVGAHAFEPESGDGQGSFSICGSVPRPRVAGCQLSGGAIRCKMCERVIRNGGPVIDPHGPLAYRAYRGTPP